MSRFKGREAEALEEAIRSLAEATGRSYGQVEAALDEVVTPTLTAGDIDRKNYTYCSYLDVQKDVKLKFLVPSVHKEAAWGMARNYLRDRGIKPITKTVLQLYPKNYVVEARRLFAEGHFYQTERQGDSVSHE